MKTKIFAKAASYVLAHKNGILTAVEIAGVALTAYATYKAANKIRDIQEDENYKELSSKEKAIKIAKAVTPAAAAVTITVGACLFKDYIRVQDIATGAALLKMSKQKNEDLIEGAKMTVGEKKTKEVEAASRRVAAERIYYDDRPWVNLGPGEHPVIDLNSQSKFKAPVEDVWKGINAINEKMLNLEPFDEDYITVNDLLFEWNLPRLGSIGDNEGFPAPCQGGKILAVENGNLWVDSILIDGIPVMTINYETHPCPSSYRKIKGEY